LFLKINKEKKMNLNIPNVYLWAIVSEKYDPKPETKNNFDKIIYWDDIYKLYNDYGIFKRANEIYRS
jgi:hypothetical protein